MSGSSYSVEGGKGGSTSGGWALHELAENHQFASGVIVSLLALGMAFGILGLIAALPHTNLDDINTDDRIRVQFQNEARKPANTLDTPQAFVLGASQDMDDAMTGGNHQWVGQVARPPIVVAEASLHGGGDGPNERGPHRG